MGKFTIFYSSSEIHLSFILFNSHFYDFCKKFADIVIVCFSSDKIHYISKSKIFCKNRKNYYSKSKIRCENYKNYYLKRSKSQITSLSQRRCGK